MQAQNESRLFAPDRHYNLTVFRFKRVIENIGGGFIGSQLTGERIILAPTQRLYRLGYKFAQHRKLFKRTLKNTFKPQGR